jgi:hypothetical protein
MAQTEQKSGFKCCSRPRSLGDLSLQHCHIPPLFDKQGSNVLLRLARTLGAHVRDLVADLLYRNTLEPAADQEVSYRPMLL